LLGVVLKALTTGCSRSSCCESPDLLGPPPLHPSPPPPTPSPPWGLCPAPPAPSCPPSALRPRPQSIGPAGPGAPGRPRRCPQGSARKLGPLRQMPRAAGRASGLPVDAPTAVPAQGTGRSPWRCRPWRRARAVPGPAPVPPPHPPSPPLGPRLWCPLCREPARRPWPPHPLLVGAPPRRRCGWMWRRAVASVSSWVTPAPLGLRLQVLDPGTAPTVTTRRLGCVRQWPRRPT
jgi:hypothetical protein